MEVNVRRPLVCSSYSERCVSLRSLADLEGTDPAPKRGLRRVTSDSVARAARKWRGSLRDDGRESELDPARKHTQFGWPLQVRASSFEVPVPISCLEVPVLRVGA